MDPITVQGETSSNWTDERHLHFLAAMEATFVRTMLVQSSSPSGSGNFWRPHHRDQEEKQVNNTGAVRLDRYVPDMSESTVDLHSKRRTASTKSAASVLMRHRIMKRSARNISSRHRRIRVPLTTPSQDQVVPQLLLLQDKKQLPTSNM